LIRLCTNVIFDMQLSIGEVALIIIQIRTEQDCELCEMGMLKSKQKILLVAPNPHELC
jgi:hypothetical protein